MRKLLVLMLVGAILPAGYTAASEGFDIEAMNKEILEFSGHLETCTPYEAVIIHIMTGDELSRKIVGMEAGKCIYIEEMPQGGKMTCKYPESMLTPIAAYYRKAAKAESFSVNVKSSYSDSAFESESTYSLNGKVVENPLQEVLENGVCVISGYSLGE
ncbi:MAG: hypothetical protein KDJ38_03900 [Gammaproteobacteria bacterium]|nr:hypothetical protein [Gammaproteobacteria bacterium]